MKLKWLEVKHGDLEFHYYWTKETGWVEKSRMSHPIYVLSYVSNATENTIANDKAPS